MGPASTLFPGCCQEKPDTCVLNSMVMDQTARTSSKKQKKPEKRLFEQWIEIDHVHFLPSPTFTACWSTLSLLVRRSISKFTLINSGYLHKILQQADFERDISMDRHRDSSGVSCFGVNMMTSLRSSQLPTFLLKQFCEVFP